MIAMINAKQSGFIPSLGSPGGKVLTHGNKKWYDKKTLETVRFGTWNVRTMAQAGQLENTIQEMERLKIQVLGVSEMRWPGSGFMDVENHRIYHSGTSDNTYQYGVGMIIQKRLVNQVTNFVPLTDRIMLLQISARPANVNIVQVYAPTKDHSNEEVLEFYSQIADILKALPKHDLNMVMGDFNAKVGKGKSGKHIGEFGLGERNDRGELLCTFAVEHDLIVTNTFFQQHPRRLYTWKSPDKRTRNQIDFVLINDRFKNSLLSIKTYPGADVKSDHNPLVGKLRTRLKKVKKKKPIMRYDYRILKANTIKNTVVSKLQAIGHQQNKNTPVTEDLDHLKLVINKIKEEHLKPNPVMKKRWMTEEILALMTMRSSFKNQTEQ
uniref:Craniofacial development protein 2 n=1 Tax=Cacopsylla melanoneura TaxID=428564 RepID=A0A8D8T3N0_9HEMI